MSATDLLFTALTHRLPRTEEQRLFGGSDVAPHLQRRDLLRSDAFLQARGQRGNTAEGIFIAAGEPGRPRIGVISNCQGPELARWLALSTSASTIGLEIMAYDPSQRDHFLRPFSGCDWILTAPLHSEQFRGLNVNELSERFAGRVLTIPSINFSGLYPDIVQLGAMNGRLSSPIDAHSRLIVEGYLRDLSIDDTLALFSSETFAARGFYDRWAIAEAELRRRDASCHIQIADDLMDLCRREPALFTENHPAGSVYLVIARQVARLIGAPFREPPTAMLPPIHALTTAWPVYDEIAEHHRLEYRTTQLYSTLDQMLNRRQLTERCFAAYDLVDRAALAAAAKNRSIPFG